MEKKKFAVHLSGKQKHLMTEELIKDHAAYLRSLKEKGVLPFCGPAKDGTALMIIDAPDADEAKRYVEGDPFSQVNYYQERRIVEIEEAGLSNDFFLDEVLEEIRSRNTPQEIK